MGYELFVSLRYLRAKRKHVFISVISFISIGGVALGVAALMITLSIMNGFQLDIKKKIVANSSDIVIINQDNAGLSDVKAVREKAEAVSDVIATSPFVLGQVMLKYRDSASGAVIKGIIPELTNRVLDIESNTKIGDFSRLSEDKAGSIGGRAGIVLGCELARNLGVTLGKTISVMSPSGKATHLGFIPRIKRFRVIGIFDSGMYEYDSSLGYVSMAVAKEMFGMGGKVSGIEVKIKDMFSAGRVASKIQDELGYPYWVRSWIDTNRNLFSALKLEKFVMAIVLILIVLVAAFNIVCTLIMMTLEKTRDIGVLKAMGAKNGSIMNIFIFQGAVIGVIGTFIGTVSGYIICRLIDRYEFIKLPAEVYYLSTVPVRIQVNDILFICIGAILVSLLSTIYPALQASKLDPCEAIRHY